MFTKKILSNCFFRQTLLSVDSWEKKYADDIGVTYKENGDVGICLYAPDNENVEVVFATNGTMIRSIRLKKDEKGCFRGVLPFDDAFTGPANVEVLYDGVSGLAPYLPIFWTNNRPYNIVEIPDREMDYLLIQDVPHGTVSTNIFRAQSTRNWERCTVYTPAGYMKDTKDYPVLYLLNGGTDNETSWNYVGRMSNIFDNLMAKNECVPFIAVCVNSMLREKGEVAVARDHAVESMLLEDCIPYIESNYRAKTGKWNRAIGGLSMGAYMTCDIAFANPEIFGYMGTFTASMSQTAEQKREQYDATGFVRPYPEFLKKTAKELDEIFKVYFRSTTPQEDHLELYLEDDRLLHEAGFDQANCYTRLLYDKRISKWNSWRMGLRDYSKLLFREE